MISKTSKAVVYKKPMALSLVGFGIWIWAAFILSDGSRWATLGRYAGMGILLFSFATLAWRSYRLNVLEATQKVGKGAQYNRKANSDLENEHEEFDWLHDSDLPEWFMRYTQADLSFDAGMVVVAAVPFVFEWGGQARLPLLGIIPFPWYMFPLIGIAGFIIHTYELHYTMYISSNEKS